VNDERAQPPTERLEHHGADSWGKKEKENTVHCGKAEALAGRAGTRTGRI
jgi:hypothetical protein